MAARISCGYLVAMLAVGGCRAPAPGSTQPPAPASSEAPDPIDSPKVLTLTTFATYAPSSPDSDGIDLEYSKDGSGRIFLGTNEGKILAFSSTGASLGVLLNMATPGAAPDFSGELRFVTRGLSYFAFHPDYGRRGSPGEGKLYTLYRTTIPGARAPDYSGAALPTKPGDVLSQFAIAEWTVDPDDPNRVDHGSRHELIRFEISGPNLDNHSMGKIAFNPFVEPDHPDYGLLYIPLGDTWSGGGLHNWQHVQDADNPFGKVLCIDPLANGDDPYSIPGDNPFADGGPVLDDDGNAEEIAAVGFRYPENLSFARGRRRQCPTGGVRHRRGRVRGSEPRRRRRQSRLAEHRRSRRGRSQPGAHLHAEPITRVDAGIPSGRVRPRHPEPSGHSANRLSTAWAGVFIALGTPPSDRRRRQPVYTDSGRQAIAPNHPAQL